MLGWYGWVAKWVAGQFDGSLTEFLRWPFDAHARTPLCNGDTLLCRIKPCLCFCRVRPRFVRVRFPICSFCRLIYKKIKLGFLFIYVNKANFSLTSLSRIRTVAQWNNLCEAGKTEDGTSRSRFGPAEGNIVR